MQSSYPSQSSSTSRGEKGTGEDEERDSLWNMSYKIGQGEIGALSGAGAGVMMGLASAPSNTGNKSELAPFPML